MSDVHQLTVRGDAPKLREFADRLTGKRIREGVRAFAIPADSQSYSEAIDNGAISALHAAGFTICDPDTDDPALAKGETGVAWPGEDFEDVFSEILA